VESDAVTTDPTTSDRPTRDILETIWRDVLQTDQFDVDDNFFALGGSSFDAVVVIARLNDELGTDVSEIGLFERPTIRAMTELLRSADGADSGGDILHSQRRGERRRAIERVRVRRDAP
jgi:aryl carrier-like protein